MTAPRAHHHPGLFDDHRWAVGAAVGLYLAAAALMILLAVAIDSVQPIDDAWRDAMVAIEVGPVTFLAKIFNVVGSTWFTLPIRLVLTGYLWSKRRMEQLTVWVLAWVVSDILVSLLKALYGRSRPLESLVSTSNSSFPSGHAIAGAVTAVALVIVFLPAGAHRRIWELAAGSFAFVMALSRTYLRAHWLSDVVAGALIGTATAIGVAAIVHLWWLRRRAPITELANE